MESHNYLGIYLRQDRATVACVATQGRDRKLLDCFSVLVEGPEQTPQAMADRIAQACSQRGVRFGEAAVAVDCALFMQHTVHSEFTDYKKISATIRFDTEEALATDVTDVAVAFRIVSSDESGSSLDVYTMPRAALSDILLSLQSRHIDPVTVDPDVYCLHRYLSTYGRTDQQADKGALYAVLSDSRGYLLGIPKPPQPSTMRAFPVAVAQDRGQLLTREVLITTALAGSVGATDGLYVVDTQDAVNPEELAAKVGLPVQACAIAEMAAIESPAMADCVNPVDVALAYGATLALPEKDKSVNFRNDHMPYQGAKQRTNKALKLLSIALTVLLLAVGVFFHTQWLKVEKSRRELRRKFEPDYLAVMLGKRQIPKMQQAVKDLEGALKTVRHETTGIGAEESLSARLTQTLEAINSCAKATDLYIDSVRITERDIYVNGSTTGRGQAVSSVFDAFAKAGFAVEGDRVNSKGDRNTFAVTIKPQTPVVKTP